MKEELSRRQSHTEQVLALFRQNPLRWLHWRRIEKVGGACAWRTRISDARKIAAKDGGRIEHNGSVARSAYRFVPYQPLGPDAATDRTQLRLGGW